MGVTTPEGGQRWRDDLAAAVATAGHHTALFPLLPGVHERKPA
jgi:hypothetical protein